MAEDPGIRFLRQFQSQSSIDLHELMQSYAQFILADSDSYRFPIDLELVFKRYELLVQEVPLIGQRGAVTADLRILINSSDKRQIQKYSLAHELIEILVRAILEHDLKQLPEKQIIELVDKDKKEYWCERGAAELVMPMRFVLPFVQENGVSMQSAQTLARNGGVSLIATTRRMLETNLRKCALVSWYYGHKPNDDMPSQRGQMTFWENMDPPKKLRVEWAYKATNVGHIREHKSVEPDTVIGRAFRASSGSLFRGYDYLEITSSAGDYLVEAIPTSYGGDNRVLSLIFFDDKVDSGQ